MWGVFLKICREYGSVRHIKVNFEVYDLLMEVKVEVTQKLEYI